MPLGLASMEKYTIQGDKKMALWNYCEIGKLIKFLEEKGIFEEIQRCWENKLILTGIAG